jgi:hypothetical protein
VRFENLPAVVPSPSPTWRTSHHPMNRKEVCETTCRVKMEYNFCKSITNLNYLKEVSKVFVVGQDLFIRELDVSSTIPRVEGDGADSGVRGY